MAKFAYYASIFLRLRPKNPMLEANSHTAAGAGTALTALGRLTEKVKLNSGAKAPSIKTILPIVVLRIGPV